MSAPYVSLIRVSHPFQISRIEQILKSERIPFDHANHSQDVIFGSSLPIGYHEFRVAPERLQDAKDALCAGGIVCEVSHRLLNRVLHEVIEPLLESDERNYKHLTHLIEINNRETIHAIFERTLELQGGRELLEDLFFEKARESAPGLHALARSLADGATAGFLRRYEDESISGDNETRIGLLEVLGELPSSELRRKVMAVALADEDVDVRDAASEALFSMTGSSCDYDPSDPAETRSEVVERILEGPLSGGPDG